MIHSEGQMSSSRDRKMTGVIDRLSLLTEPNKVKRLSKAIDASKNRWLTDRTHAESAFKTLREKYIYKQEKGTLDEATKESYQAALAGYLFAENKKAFGKDGKAGYDTEREGRQIEAVARVLDRQHLHMGTGEGKSSVVIPISAIVDAATNGKGKVVVGSANSQLVSELKGNIDTYLGMVQELACNKENLIETASISPANGHKGEKTVKQLMRDTLLKNEAGARAKKKQFDSYWENIVNTVNEPIEESYYEASTNYVPGDISIYVGEERNIVFDWMGNRRAFEKNCPDIIMDEAHVAFDRRSPYAKTSGSEAISHEAIQAGISEWLAHYIVAQKLRAGLQGGLIQSGKGGYELSDKGAERVRSVNMSEIAVDGKDEDSDAFMKGVNIICDNIGYIPPNKRIDTARELLKNMKHFLPYRTRQLQLDIASTNQSAYFESIGNEVAKMLPNKEKMFTTNKKGIPKLRDAYIDQLLSDNKYNPSTQVAVLAIAGKFEPIERSIAYKTSTYASFVRGVQDKIIALSGTLMTPDPLKQQMRKGAFAEFLEATTNRKVHMLASPEIKSFPRPHLFDQPDELYASLIDDMEREQMRPTLIVDNGSLESAQETHRRLVEKYGKKRVQLLLSKPAAGDTKEEQDYERNLKQYCQQLADGEIDILVSSGSASLGTNFTKSKAEMAEGINTLFPDMRTITIGMPESEEKMSQTLGRRRLLEGVTQNHSWYLTQGDIEQYISYFTDEKNQTWYDLKKGKNEMRNDIQKARGNPDELFKRMIELWDKARAARATDTEFEIGYDTLMDTEVIPTAEMYLKKKIALQILGFDENSFTQMYTFEESQKNDGKAKLPDEVEWELKKKKELTNWVYRQMGLPSTIYTDIQQGYSLLPSVPRSSSNFVSAGIADRLNDIKRYIFTNPESDPAKMAGFGINTYLDGWFESGREAVTDYMETTKLRENIDIVVPEKNSGVTFTALKPFFIPPGGSTDEGKKLNTTNWNGKEYVVYITEYSYNGTTMTIPLFYDEQTQKTLVPLDPLSQTLINFPPEELKRIENIQIQTPHEQFQYHMRPIIDNETGKVRAPGELVDIFALNIKTTPKK